MKTVSETSTFIDEVSERSGQPIANCYYCQKCASGCPIASFCDRLPYELLRFVELGMKDEALNNSFLWLCAACGTCGARCPNEIDIGRVADALKEISTEEKAKAGEEDVKLFHKLFLNNMKRYGRLHEASMIGMLKMRTGKIFDDLWLGFELMKKGKLKLFPSYIKGHKEIQRLFKEVEKSRAQNVEQASSNKNE